MNTEQLKMIIDALQSMGAQGKDAFIWWLVLDKLPSFFSVIALFCTFIVIARMTFSHLRRTEEQTIEARVLSEAERAAEAIRRAWLYGSGSDRDTDAFRLYQEVSKWAKSKGAR